jgi:hypothetical protein
MGSELVAAPVPTGDELAAIAAAYVLLVPSGEGPEASPEPPSRWRLAARLAAPAARRGGATSRWNAAGRVDV